MRRELESESGSESEEGESGDYRPELSYEPVHDEGRGVFFVDIAAFLRSVTALREAVNKRLKRAECKKLLEGEWIEHYCDKVTGRKVLAEFKLFEHDHERRIAICLAQMNYDVVFAPSGLFKPSQKKFDVYILRDYIIQEADLKFISSKNPLTISNRIKYGSEQAARVVVYIASDIEPNSLIEGLRSGAYKSKLLKEILLFYRNKFYRLL